MSRIENMEIKDIIISPNFIYAYDNAPPEARKSVDKVIRMISVSGKLPNSMQAHKAASTDTWIGYITRTGQHWRVLFHKEGAVLVFDELLDHDDQDIVLKELVK